MLGKHKLPRIQRTSWHYQVLLGLKPSEQEHIYDCTTAKEDWDHSEDIYSGKGVHRLLSMMKSLMESKVG
jgi:hypothetical protein